MRVLISKWCAIHDPLISTGPIFPKDSDWKIVRCINQDNCYDFYFMAYFILENKEWYFFDEEYNGGEMQVTHWMTPPKIEFDIEYSNQEKSE